MKNLFSALAFAGTLLASLAASAGQPLVDGGWLKANQSKPDLVVLDVRTAAEYGAGHIPGAVHSDYAVPGWRVTLDGIPGMLPPVADLEKLVGSLGIGNDDHVVVVPAGLTSSDFGNATRVYWTFKVLGHDKVSVLDGGQAAWAADAANPVSKDPAQRPAKTFKASPRPELVASLADVQAAVKDGKTPLVDARPVDQYLGKAKAPVAKTAGTLPGAVNVDNGSLYDPAAKRFASADVIKALADKAKVPADGKQIAFCNTGHWASIGWFALSEVAGNKQVTLYDGSMAEWTNDPSRPVVNGTPN